MDGMTFSSTTNPEVTEAAASPTLLDWLSGLSGGFSAILALVAVVVAVWSLSINRRDRATELAAGLHADMHVVPWRLEPHLEDSGEPGRWSADDMVLTLRNSSEHPYYSIVASVPMVSRDELWAARANVISPGQVLVAKVGELDGTGDDTLHMDETTQVRLTFRDSAGRAWRRESDGRLYRQRMPRSSERNSYRIYDRASPSAALHRIREHGDASIGIELRDDVTGWPVMLSEAGPGESEQDGLAGLYTPRIVTQAEMEAMIWHEGPLG